MDGGLKHFYSGADPNVSVESAVEILTSLGWQIVCQIGFLWDHGFDIEDRSSESVNMPIAGIRAMPSMLRANIRPYVDEVNDALFKILSLSESIISLRYFNTH